jgi:7-keto-8-aminopelargonate synthetase-like enzyme
MIEPQPLQQTDRTRVLFQGRKLAYFSGCDYFRLASHPRVIAALGAGLKKYGLNVAASRLTTGNHRLYGELEGALMRFFGAEAALLVPTGYLTNLIVAQALAGQFSHALIDEDSHPTLSDATRWLDCPVLRFKHRDPADLAETVRRCGPESRLILLTDGMFSRDGSAPPLKDYLKVLPADAVLLVDDAHGAGVLGRTGRGTLEHCGVGRRRIIQTITLSKAFGSYGGAILGTARLRQRILDRSRMFVASTPFPLPLASAALQSVKLLQAGKALRQRLACNAAHVKDGLRRAGLPLPQAPGPIVPVFPKSPAAAAKLYRALLAAGIYPPFVKYPGGPAAGYFRFVISSEHSPAQLGALLSVLTPRSRSGRSKA